MYRLFAAAALVAVVGAAGAEQPRDFETAFSTAAKQAEPGFQGFDAARGREFFNTTHGGEWSCSSCHTDNPAAAGKHAVTGKTIQPMAPAANAERFTKAAKVEKWFTRNCRDVVKRACTAREKGDVLAYLLSVKP